MNFNEYWENRVVELHREIERLRAEQQIPSEVQALRVVIKTQQRTIEKLEEQIDGLDTTVIKEAARYRKLRDLPWDSHTHPELWDAINCCPRAGKQLDETIDDTL